ncbi:MSCRAMM family protein [Carboxylicivirga marina]|uniref:Carboxypeptidase regulatory-like domain-containing protein n=1 Tax=Carboxylicivirga marina TaxID=2800988 RepID=A0ABS1HE95_9BACT|nr:carboxypeptidase-like regulatory domain-containing protein [Carboxylicivirga marina]MBK3515943.1 carboxypeptidase regulatory-like domain-containing protein [Carboxylicivirga marina]
MKKIFGLLLVLVVAFSGCNDDDDDDDGPTTGIIKGMVTDADSNTALPDVSIMLFDATTNEAVGATIKTDAEGKYSVTLEPGMFYLKLFKQGYNNNPPAGVTPLNITVSEGSESVNDFKMEPSDVVDGGSITGKVSVGGNGVMGAYVVASMGDMGYAAATDKDGNYFIYNLPAGTYSTTAFIVDHNATPVSVTVTANTNSVGDIILTADASSSLSGTLTFLATEGKDVNVNLLHPATGEPIPGLVDMSENMSYSMSGIPNGEYLVKASFENDTYVVDPDWIIKNGEPMLNASGSASVINFSLTGAVTLNRPTNELSTTVPVEISSTTPTFEWTPYSSTSDYVIEVSDANGNVIWGGFNNDGALPVKNISIEATSIVYNSDGMASIANLEYDVVYRWKIYASKDDTKEPTLWKLISVSEDQMGLFIVKEQQ